MVYLLTEHPPLILTRTVLLLLFWIFILLFNHTHTNTESLVFFSFFLQQLINFTKIYHLIYFISSFLCINFSLCSSVFSSSFSVSPWVASFLTQVCLKIRSGFLNDSWVNPKAWVVKELPAHDRSYTAPNSINDSKTMGKQ